MGNTAKHSVRFGVGNGTVRAASWIVFANPRKRDVYVSCRPLDGVVKLSLHESGDWRYAFDYHRFPTLFEHEAQPTSRLIRSYPAPPPISPGYTLACRIHTSPAAVNLPHGANEAKVTWLPPAPEGELLEVAVFLCDREQRSGEWPGRLSMGTSFVGQFPLAGGGCVCVVYKRAPLYDAIIDLRKGKRHLLKGMGTEVIKVGESRAVAISTHRDGSIVLREGVLLPPTKKQLRDLDLAELDRVAPLISNEQHVAHVLRVASEHGDPAIMQRAEEIVARARGRLK